MTMSIAGFSPIPTMGIARASSAMLGMDCKTFAMLITILETTLFCRMSIPTGTPIARAINTASIVMFICWMNKSNNSAFLSIKSCQKSAI